MPRRTIGYILIALLLVGALPASASGPTVAEQVAGLKTGRKIKVKLRSGEILKGRMGAATTDQFSLESRGSAQGVARSISFSEAESVKADGLTTGEKWLIFGVIWVVVGIVGARLT
jgi:hypothetical protein